MLHKICVFLAEIIGGSVAAVVVIILIGIGGFLTIYMVNVIDATAPQFAFVILYDSVIAPLQLSIMCECGVYKRNFSLQWHRNRRQNRQKKDEVCIYLLLISM